MNFIARSNGDIDKEGTLCLGLFEIGKCNPEYISNGGAAGKSQSY